MNCIIVHGCPDNDTNPTYNKHWMPWTKKSLEMCGVDTEIPLMPNPWSPVYDDHREEFEKLDIDEETILIGHSCGCTFLARWLAESKQKIKKLIFVAPWKVYEGDDEFRVKFYSFLIDETIKDRVGEIIMFTSNNEELDGKKSLEIFHKALGGEIIDLENHGHYCLNDMGTEEFPELIDAVLR